MNKKETSPDFQENGLRKTSYSLESDLIHEKMRNHPLFLMLKEIGASLTSEMNSKIQRVREPTEEKKKEYESLTRTYEELRGTPLFYPYIGSGIGNGPYVLLEDGSIKLDFISGIGAHYWGHSHPELQTILAISTFFEDTVMQGNLQQSRVSFELASLLTTLSSLDHCFFSTSGAMACENALKLLFQKAFPKNRVLAFESSFAGRTIALSQITDKAAYRKGLPLLLHVDYIPFFDESLGVEKSVQRTIDAVQNHLKRYPDMHACFVGELIQGEGGFRVGNAEYFKKLITFLKEKGLYIWIDEVQTFSRTKELFASSTFQILDMVDVITIGKVSQVSATLFRSHLKPQPGLISQTFTGSSTAFHAALWGIQKAINDTHFGAKGKIEESFRLFSQKLENLSISSENKIKGPWGIGSMVSITLFDGDEKKTTAFAKRLFENGLIGFVCGSNPTKIRFLLPIGVIDESHLDEAIEIISKTLQERERF